MEKFEKAANIIKTVLGLLATLCYFIWMGVECVNKLKEKFPNRTRRELRIENAAYKDGWEDAERVFCSKDEAEEN